MDFVKKLTVHQQQRIRKLVINECANYDHYGTNIKICLPSDKPCSMLCATEKGSLCDYFKKSVLPPDPELESMLMGNPVASTKQCVVCDNNFIPTGRQVYCSESCEAEGRRAATAKRVTKYRKKVG